MKLDKKRTLNIIRAALKEDIGAGDVTAVSAVGSLESVKASVLVNEDCVLCGIDVAEWTMNALDCSVRFKPQAGDGQRIYKGKEIIFLEGHARSILSAERTILNFLSLMSGVATKTGKFVEKTASCAAEIYDTRKTFPLLRYLEKYAVRTGGGRNHRFGLWEQVLVKENHLKAADIGTGENFVRDLRKKITKNLKIEIEVESLEQFKSVLKQRPDIIMLDNMSVRDAKKACLLRDRVKPAGPPFLEVSGGINLDNVKEYAETGVDRISVGSLTDSVESVDMSMEIK